MTRPGDVLRLILDGQSPMSLDTIRNLHADGAATSIALAPRDDLAAPTTYHLWLLAPTWDDNDLLCARANRLPRDTWADHYQGAIGITTDPDEVTCRECIEWMHA